MKAYIPNVKTTYPSIWPKVIGLRPFHYWEDLEDFCLSHVGGPFSFAAAYGERYIKTNGHYGKTIQHKLGLFRWPDYDVQLFFKMWRREPLTNPSQLNTDGVGKDFYDAL